MKYLIIFLTVFSFTARSQQIERWIYGLENQKDSLYTVKDSSFTEKYSEYDFSNLLTPNSNFLGFIGADYKRIEMVFQSVKKSNKNKAVYNVMGKSTVGSNTCDFNGTITFNRVREYKAFHLGVDRIYADSGIVSQGFVIAEYELNESKSQKYSGTFKGTMTIWFYIDKTGKLQYDNIDNHSDSYRNNQYAGTWSQYGSEKTKACNWGERRIPLCGDLDIGAGEFSVNPKYKQNGW